MKSWSKVLLRNHDFSTLDTQKFVDFQDLDIIPDTPTPIRPKRTTTMDLANGPPDLVQSVTCMAEKHRKRARMHSSPGYDKKVVNVNSTKIVIKALNANPSAQKVVSPTKVADTVQTALPNYGQTVKNVEYVEISDESFSVAQPVDQEKEITANLSAKSGNLPNTSTPKRSREIEKLQRTVTESKMLTEFMHDSESGPRRAKRQLTSLRSGGDASDNESPRTSRTFDHSRSRSPSSNKRTDSPTVEGKSSRRNMRSHNAEFSAKQQKFLINIQQQQQDFNSDASENSDQEHGHLVFDTDDGNEEPRALRVGSDIYCWHCHKSRTSVACTTCKRSFHTYCLRFKANQMSEEALKTWRCDECHKNDVIGATKKPKYSRDELTTMLKFAIQRCQKELMNKHIVFPSDPKIIVNEMNVGLLDRRINAKTYFTAAAFASDFKWIQHNCIISGDYNTKTKTAVRNMQRIIKQDMYDIDTCPECYYSANTRPDHWFEEVCTRPHILLWAKLKGFPFWPAKGMAVNNGPNAGTQVDVRFFGEHDRSWVPVRDCFLFSKEDPNPNGYKYKRNSILDSMKEVDMHINKIKLKFGSFTYAPLKQAYNPTAEDEQLEILIPNLRQYLAQPQSVLHPELTIKIVKTAGNNMSIVKKADSSMVVSKIWTPPSDNEKNMLQSRKSSHKTEGARESNQKTADNGEDPIMHSYQVMNSTNTETSHSTDISQVGKVKAVILKRQSRASICDKKKITEPVVKVVPKLDMIKKRALRASIATWKKPRLDASRQANVRRRAKSLAVAQFSNFLGDTSSGEMKMDVVDAIASSAAASNGDKAQSTMADVPDYTAAVSISSTVSDPIIVDHPDESGVCVPMMEIKQEEQIDEQFILSSSQSSLNVSDLTRKLLDIKPELVSEEELDGDDIISENPVPVMSQPLEAENKPSIQPVRVPEVQRGNVTVKNMAKLKNPAMENKMNHQHPQLKSAKAKNTKNTKQQLPHGVTFTIKPNNINSMVYIPMSDGQYFTNENLVSMPKDSVAGRTATSIATKSQPPPLASVSLASVPMQSLLTVNNLAPIASITHVPATTQKSLLTDNRKQTINPPNASAVHISASPNAPSISFPPPLSLVQQQIITSMPNSSAHVQTGPNRDHTTNHTAQHLLSDMIPDQLARAVTDTLARGTPPPLMPKPTGALRSQGVGISTSVDAGPVSQLLTKNSYRMVDFFRSIIEDTLADIGGTSATSVGNLLEARYRLLQIENERLRQEHANELSKVRMNTDQILSEMQNSIENEKSRLIADTRRICELERIQSVEDTKKKQWCIQCLKEAQFHCCWNTSYCGFKCQEIHWLQHMPYCAQQREKNAGIIYANSTATTIGPTVTTRTISKTTAANKQKTLGNTIVRVTPQAQRNAGTGAQQIMSGAVQPPATSFKLQNRPVNCVVVPSTAPITTHIPSHTHTYSATSGGNSLLLNSAGQPTNPIEQHALRIVSTTSLAMKKM